MTSVTHIEKKTKTKRDNSAYFRVYPTDHLGLGLKGIVDEGIVDLMRVSG